MEPSVQDLHNHAVERVLMNIVCALHENNVLPARKLADRLEQSNAFGQAAFQKEKNPVFDVLVVAFREIADAYEKLDQQK